MNKYDAISKLIQSICKLGSDRNAQNLENTKSLFAQLSLQFRHDPQTFRKLITLVYFDQIMSINEMACSIGVHGSEIEPLVGDYFTSECLSCQEDIYFFADSIEEILTVILSMFCIQGFLLLGKHLNRHFA